MPTGGDYPNYVRGDTFVVKRPLFRTDADGDVTEVKLWEEARSEVEALYGKIFEDVITQDKAEKIGIAYFRVAKPWGKESDLKKVKK